MNEATRERRASTGKKQSLCKEAVTLQEAVALQEEAVALQEEAVALERSSRFVQSHAQDSHVTEQNECTCANRPYC